MSRSARGWRRFAAISTLTWSSVGRIVKLQVALTLTLVLLSSILTAVSPIPLTLAVDAFTSKTAALSNAPFIYAGVYCLVQWLLRVFGLARDYLYGRAERRLNRALSGRVFEHLMQLPLRFHLERKTGAINQAVMNGLQGFQIILQQLVFTAIPVIVEFATIAFVLIHLHQPQFLGVLLATLVCYGILFGIGMVRVAGPARAAAASQAEASGTFTDSLLNYETVKCFGAEASTVKRFDEGLARTESDWTRFFRARLTNGLAASTLFVVLLAFASLHAAWRTQQGAMSVGDFVLVGMYVFQMVRPAEMVGAALQQFSQGFAFLEKVADLLDQTPEPQIPGPGGPAVATEADVRFERVHLSYLEGRAVLEDVSFHVPAGKTLGIVGASGAGKSSLVRLLMRLVDPIQGRILLDGMPTVELPLETLRNSIAVVPQDTVLFNDSIRYNIALGKPGSTQEEIERAARLARLHDFVLTLPEGYETQVGERGVKLSGGERQRVAIARAALKHPRIYVFDEATSSLDSRTEQEILHNIREISRSSTSLIIAHRLSTVVHADEIVVLDEGRIIERGTHRWLLARNGKYASLWHAQHASRLAEPATNLA